MPVWIVLGLGIWMLCGLLAVAIACAANRGDRLSSEALMGADPAQAVAPRRRIVVEVTPVARPWASPAGSAVSASVLAEAGTQA
jgi:hypothetical protein